MKCPLCGGDTKVRNSRKAVNGGNVCRQRACLECDFIGWTVENYVEEKPNFVQPRSEVPKTRGKHTSAGRVTKKKDPPVPKPKGKQLIREVMAKRAKAKAEAEERERREAGFPAS